MSGAAVSGAVRVAGVLAVSLALLSPTISGASPRPPASRFWAPMKGIAVSLTSANVISDARAMAIGNELFSMLHTKFHANAVSLNFPFFQSSSTSDDPERAAMTPSPGRLAMLTALAHRYGLSVQYRPFLWEGDLHDQSRPTITPTNVAAWFHNYWRFLEPYLESANEAGVASFSVAMELTSLLPWTNWPCSSCLSRWEQLVQQARTVYDGPLFYSQQHDPQETIPLTERGYDAYQPIHLASDADVSIGALTNGFVKNLQMPGMQSTPTDLTIEELAIPAVSGAYNVPNNFDYPPGTPVVRKVQADWFAGACRAFKRLRLAGLYYWSIDFNTFTPGENSSSSIYNWLGTASAATIQSCFATTPA